MFSCEQSANAVSLRVFFVGGEVNPSIKPVDTKTCPIASQARATRTEGPDNTKTRRITEAASTTHKITGGGHRGPPVQDLALLTQRLAIYFAAIIFRQVYSEFDPSRILVRREPFFYEILQLGRE